MAIKNTPNFREDIGTKINWSEPREMHAVKKENFAPNKSEMHLQNANTKKPIFKGIGGDKFKYQVFPTENEDISNEAPFLGGEWYLPTDLAKKNQEEGYIKDKTNKYLINILNSKQFSDEEKIDYMKKLKTKNNLNYNDFDLAGVARKVNLSPNIFFRSSSSDFDELLKDIDDPSLRRVNADELAQIMRLRNYYFNRKNAKPLSWYKNQTRIFSDYASSLTRNKNAISNGNGYYTTNYFLKDRIFSPLLEAINNGKDIQPLLKKWSARGDLPQTDLNETYEFNTSPGRYRKQMDAKKRLNELGQKERLSESEIDEYQKLSRLLKR